MEAKRRQQQQQQQQQLCVQALHPQQMGAPCGAPLGYPASPWVLWDAGQLMEAAARKRKKKRRMYAACLLAGVAVVVLAVAGVAGLAVYLGGSPPTESSANWESFRRAGEARYGEEPTTHRVLGRHGVLVRADPPTERTTPPARSPWSIRREESLSRWEGRGQGGGDGGTPGAISRADRVEEEEATAEEEVEEAEGFGEVGGEDYSEGVPEVEVVLENGEVEPVGDGSEAVESVEGNPGHRSPHARASDAAKAAAAAGGGTGASGPIAAPAGGEGDEAARVPTTLVEYVTTISVVQSPVRSAAVDSGVLRRNERRKGEGAKYAGASSGGGGGEDAAEEEDESVEGVVEEESRRGGEERRYEQLQVSNKAASGGVPVFNILTKILNRVNGSSGIKELENAEKKHSDNGTMECSAGEFRCAVLNGGIMCLPGSSRCDGARDCFLNGEDEIGCTCADTLRSRFLHRKLCDGVPDCWDYSDEDQCEWCSPGHLVCGGGARSCVEPERICDGVKDCPGGDDESRCIALSPEEIHKEPKMMGSDGRRFYHRGSNWNGTTRGSDYVTASMVTNEVFPYRSSGYLLVRKKGVWGKLCVDSSANDGMKNLKGTKEKSWGVADIGHEVCKAMTHRDFELIEQVTDGDLLEGSYPGPPKTPYYELQSSSSQNDILGSTQSLQSTECSSKKVMRVMCRDLECGVRPKIKVNQWSRIVGGGNAAPGAWPWQAALYREGEFQCGATLISDHWLISAGHCFFRAPDDYWVARLGTLRRGTALPSPHEQRRPVSSIILHPRYVDEGFLNDIALLRLSLPVEITDHVRPICLPPRATQIPISSYHNPERVSNPASEERDPVQMTTEEGISYLYDEAISTFPSVVNSYDGLQVDFTTESPHSLHDVDEYPQTTEYNDRGFLHLSSHHGIDSMESMLDSTKDGLTTTGHSDVKDVESTNSNKFKLHISQPNRNDGKIEHDPSDMLTLTHFGDIDHLDSEMLSSSGNITSITESYEYEIHENETTPDYITEPITNQATSLMSQYIGTQSVTEEIDLKDLIREVSSLFLSTNSRPLQNSAASNSMNTIHISDIKGKNGIGDANIDELTKSTSMHSHPGIGYLSENVPTKSLNSSTKIVPVDLVSPTSSETIGSTSGDQTSEFQVRNLSDFEQIKNRYFIEHPTSHKQLESNDPTTPTMLKLEQPHDKYSNHIKNPHETPNILFLSDKFVENKHANRTASTVPPDDGEEGSQLGKQSSVKPATADIIEEMAKSIVEAIEGEGRERKTRNVVRSRQGDDGGDDGIRNGRLCTVVGWGQLFEVGKIFPDTLQEVELPLISTAECRKRTVFLPLYHLTDAMFCAGYDNGGRDACLGDSGGPLMCQEPDGHWSLYGVTSNGYGCARVNRPGVYTKVSHYIPWMEEAMAKEDSALEEKRKRDEERWREEVGGEEGWRERWEWRRRRLEEQGMGKHHCPHRCPLGECLQKARVCNGVVDCSDASDEQNCHGDLRVGR